MNFLSVENVTKSFGERVLFEHLIFGIDQGQKVAIVAKNGMGKTTLLRCLTGLDTPDSGRIVFRNDIRIGFMKQTEDLDATHTVLEEVFSHDLPELKAVKEYNRAMQSGDEEQIKNCFEAISELNAWDMEVKVTQILSVLKLADTSQLLGNLSGGQKKRVALAKVLIAEPDFLILDEPTAGLDPVSSEILKEKIMQEKKKNKLILISSHILSDLDELTTHVMYLQEGKMIFLKNINVLRRETGEDRLGKAIARVMRGGKKEALWIDEVLAQKESKSSN